MNNKELRALLEAATPGEWHCVVWEDEPRIGTVKPPRGKNGVDWDISDAQLIVTLRNIAPELLAVVEAATHSVETGAVDSWLESSLSALEKKLQGILP